MRSPSIEWLHAKLDKRIRLASSYTDMPELEFIIKACRLKPYDYIFEEKNNNITLHKWWFDEFGNSLDIIKSKKIRIVYNDLRLDKKSVICTDLYAGLSLDRVAKMSRLVYAIVGKDEDEYQDCCLLTFLGLDEHLRTYLYWQGDWQQVSPLLLGMKDLKNLANRLDVKHYQMTENKEITAIPCISSQTWLSYLPPSPAFLSELNKQSEMLAGILKP
jgi:hypothetical protein